MEQQSDLSANRDAQSAEVEVSNIGGIDSVHLEFSPGVTLLTGRNATNRTSLLSAINGVLGGTDATLRRNADEGHVSLTIDNTEYTRTYFENEAQVEHSGEPFYTDETVIDLFCTLLENNPARRAVEHGGDLHDVIMAPVDTEAIERRIRTLQEEKENLTTELERLKRLHNKLPKLEERSLELQEEIEEKDADIGELRETVAEFEADAKEAENANSYVEELDEKRQEHSSVQDDIEINDSELKALREEREELEAELDEIQEIDGATRQELESELESLRKSKRELDNTIGSLTTIVDFNKDILSEDHYELPGVRPDGEDVTAALAPSDSQNIVCWTCGSQAEQGDVADRLSDLEDVIEVKQDKRTELVEQITHVEEKIREYTETESRRETLKKELEDVASKIEMRENKKEELQSSLSELENEIEDLESKVAETEAVRENDLLDTYERLSDLQYERGQLEQQLEDVESEIEEIDSKKAPDDVESKINEVMEELEEERTRISDLESAAVEQFNGHMDDILTVLEFDNLARVWIERRTSDSGRGESDTTFELHIVREDESGTVYEDIVDNLSESEREVIGLVVALSGYLAHEVYEDIPFILLDSLEAIDSDRISAIVAYFREYTSYLLVALLPEDADAMPDTYERISSDVL